MKRRGLGRGLDVLLGQSKSEKTAQSGHIAEKIGVEEIGIERLTRGTYQPRREFDEQALASLADSIKAQGIIQPIVVREVEISGEKRLEILAGERRWRAAQIAGFKKVPVIYKEITDKEALAIALVENIQREDLNPIETAVALSRLIEEFSLTHQEAGEVIGRSRSSISNALRLLDLAEEVQELLVARKLDMGHARALLSLTPEQQVELAHWAVTHQLTVRETEQLVREMLQPKVKKLVNQPAEPDHDLLSLERSLSEYLGAITNIQTSGQGKGRVVIKYNSLDELDGILGKIKK